MDGTGGCWDDYYHQLHGTSQAVRPAGREAGCLDPPAAPAFAAAPGCAARSAGGGWQGVHQGGNGPVVPWDVGGL